MRLQGRLAVQAFLKTYYDAVKGGATVFRCEACAQQMMFAKEPGADQKDKLEEFRQEHKTKCFVADLDKFVITEGIDLIHHGIKFQSVVIKNCERLLAMGDVIEMNSQEWNYCLAALAAEGVKAIIVGL